MYHIKNILKYTTILTEWIWHRSKRGYYVEIPFICRKRCSHIRESVQK